MDAISAKSPGSGREAHEQTLLREVIETLPARGRQAFERAYPSITLRELVRMERIDLPWFGLGARVALKTGLHRIGLRLGMNESDIEHMLN
jgi:hypothetical protein